RPARVGHLVGKARVRQAFLEVEQHLVGHRDAERLDLHAALVRRLAGAGQPGAHFARSSTVMPSSRIFCWKFWRYMPTSSAALVTLPPWRWRARRRKSRSNDSTTRSFASRNDSPGPASGTESGAGAGGRPTRSSGVISGPFASSSACSTAERSSRTLPFHGWPH